MTVTAIQIGLDPDVIDCSVLIGAGVRLVASNTLLFESIVNAAHIAQPGCRFVFNRAAVATPDDIRRWYPSPEAVA
jgi:hypothetical protein